MGDATSMDRQKAARLIRHAFSNLTLRETLVVGGWSEQALNDAVDMAEAALASLPPAVLDAVERNPDLVRKIEEHNERLIAFLRERLPAPPPLGCGHVEPVAGCWHCRGAALAAGRSVPLPRRPIERYVRAAVEIRMPAATVLGAPLFMALGTIEIGLHYESGERPSIYRSELIAVAARIAGSMGTLNLDEDSADWLTQTLDAEIVSTWGDRPRFIEVWRGTGDEAEPLTQVYAPHGMPIGSAP